MMTKPQDDKYMVIRREELSRMQNDVDKGQAGTAKHLLQRIYVNQIKDAIVIRKQDVFAPPALDAYANAITCVIEALQTAEKDLGLVDGLNERIRILRKIADYFRAQAEDAYAMTRKLPD